MESRQLHVEQLLLDPENPRLPEELVGSDQATLLNWLNVEGVLNELAGSMVENGFFPHEPLIVLDAPEGEPHLVLEGNRRFATISVLLQLDAAVEAEVQFDFQVTPTVEQLDRLRQVPCFVVTSREEVRKYLGFRHIGGVKTWSPEAKARYLDAEVQRAIASGSENAFRDVGRLVGSNAAGVRGPYTALHILRAAQDVFGINTTYVMQNRFGVWNRMMNSADLRSYIGFADATTAEAVREAVHHLNPEHLTEVLSDLTPAGGQRRAVLSDSRDVTVYAAVLDNPRARETLRRYEDLELAKQIIERANLGQKIRALSRSVELLLRDINDADVTPDVAEASAALLNQARTLDAGIRARVEPEAND